MKPGKRDKTALTVMVGAALLVSVAASAQSEGLADALSLERPRWEFDNYEIELGGDANGALFAASHSSGPAYPDGYDHAGASGLVRGNIRMQRTFDTGMVLSVRSDFLIYRDALSGDQYDNDTIERIYVSLQTGFGRLDVGQQDGAGYGLGITGPLVNEFVTLENQNISLFRDPVTGDNFAGFFSQTTAVQSSSNFAKINYVSPRLFGIQIGASFTPNTVRSPLPFTGNPSDQPNQQHSIWELAGGYTGYFSNVAVGVTAGFAHGTLKNRTPGFEDFYDWAVGTQIAYSLSDSKISFGGAYRGTNAYLLDIEQARDDSQTKMVQLSATFEKASWLAGAEFSHADIEGPVGYTINGYQLAAGYKLNTNMHITLGWQWYSYDRDSGTFYNGLPQIDLNAGFLTVGYAL